MNRPGKVLNGLLTLAALIFVIGILSPARGQEPTTQNPANVNQSQLPQADQMLGPLNLTGDQIQRIRTIYADLRVERQAANLRLRQAQRALAEAVESPNPDEKLIDQRSREVAETQAETIRLRSLTEARVLQVLTPDQRLKLKEIRQQNQARRRAENQQFPVNGLGRRGEALQRNNNAMPAGPRQRKVLRPPQKR